MLVSRHTISGAELFWYHPQNCIDHPSGKKEPPETKIDLSLKSGRRSRNGRRMTGGQLMSPGSGFATMPTELRLKMYDAMQKPRAIVLGNYEQLRSDDRCRAYTNRRARLPITFSLSAESRIEALRSYRCMFARMAPGCSGLFFGADSEVGVSPAGLVNLAGFAVRSSHMPRNEAEYGLGFSHTRSLLMQGTFCPKIYEEAIKQGVIQYLEGEVPRIEGGENVDLAQAVCHMLDLMPGVTQRKCYRLAINAVTLRLCQRSLDAFWSHYLHRPKPPMDAGRVERVLRMRQQRTRNNSHPPLVLPYLPGPKLLLNQEALLETEPGTEAIVSHEKLPVLKVRLGDNFKVYLCTIIQRAELGYGRGHYECRHLPQAIAMTWMMYGIFLIVVMLQLGSGAGLHILDLLLDIPRGSIVFEDDATDEIVQSTSLKPLPAPLTTKSDKGAKDQTIFQDESADFTVATPEEDESWLGAETVYKGLMHRNVARPYLYYSEYQYVDPQRDVIVVEPCLRQYRCWTGFRNQFLKSDRAAVKRLALLIPGRGLEKLGIWDTISHAFPNVQELIYVLNGNIVFGTEKQCVELNEQIHRLTNEELENHHVPVRNDEAHLWLLRQLPLSEEVDVLTGESRLPYDERDLGDVFMPRHIEEPHPGLPNKRSWALLRARGRDDPKYTKPFPLWYNNRAFRQWKEREVVEPWKVPATATTESVGPLVTDEFNEVPPRGLLGGQGRTLKTISYAYIYPAQKPVPGVAKHQVYNSKMRLTGDLALRHGDVICE